MDRSDASAGLTFLMNGAKETRTLDPLHAMKIHAKLRLITKTGSAPSTTRAFDG